MCRMKLHCKSAAMLFVTALCAQAPTESKPAVKAGVPVAVPAAKPTAPLSAKPTMPSAALHRVLLQGNDTLAILARDGSIEWEMKWDGIHDLLIQDKEIIGIDDARTRADAELNKSAYPTVKASYVRTENILDFSANRLKVGQQQRLNFWGFDTLLTIDKVSISALSGVSKGFDDDLYFKQSVSLGQQSATLGDVIKAQTPREAAIRLDNEKVYEENL
jgi:hypothetical protein